MTRPECVQLAVIGAMQRAHPALTHLWLEWTGIRNLHLASFETSLVDGFTAPGTHVMLRANNHVELTWSAFCDVLKVPPTGPERRMMPIQLTPKSPAHDAFWSAMKKRELEETDGPLEWWWRLLVLRHKGVRAASRVLLTRVFGEHEDLDHAIVGLTNPALKAHGRKAQDLLAGSAQYVQPSQVTVSLRVKRNGNKWQGLAFSLGDANLRRRFVQALLDAAVSRAA